MFIKAVELILSNIDVVVMLNGFMSDSFSPEAGTPQGCPLSPGLFILVIEVLACALRATDSQGIICGEVERDVMNAADDTTIGAATPDSLL